MLLIIGIIFAYCRVWPPMVVVVSGSMEHPPPLPEEPRSYIGVIDTGDLVLVKKVNKVSDIITYVEGEKTGYHHQYHTFG